MPAAQVPRLDTGASVVIATPSVATKKSVRAVTLLVVSKLAVISKGSRTGGLIWTVDAATGAPVDGATLLVQETIQGNTYRYRNGMTDRSGLFIDPAGAAKNRGGRSLMVFARNGEHFAASRNFSSWYWWGFPGDYRAYSFTDRPVYRPDQEIHFKHILRRYDHGQYRNLPNQQVAITVFGPKGGSVYERTLVTNTHGSVSGDVRLPPSAALGVYRMQLKTGGRFVDGGAGARFRVEEYRKPEFEVTVSAAASRYDINDDVEIQIAARYYFGSPVADAAMSYTVSRSPVRPQFRYPSPYPWYFDQLGPWWTQNNLRCLPSYCYFPSAERSTLVQSGTLTTEDDGIAVIRIAPPKNINDSPELAQGFRYVVEANVTDSSRRTITGKGTITVSPAPFAIDVRPQRRLYQPGDTVQIDVSAKGPNGDSVPFQGRVQVHTLRSADPTSPTQPSKPLLGELIGQGDISVDAVGGGIFRMVADSEGPIRFTVVASQAEGGDIRGTCDVWITKRGGPQGHVAFRDVELIPDRDVYEIGDTMHVLVQSRYASSTVLLTIEADELLDHRVVALSGGGQVVDFPVLASDTPNVYLIATMVHGNRVLEDKRAIVVPPTKQFLSVTIDAPSETFHPREHAALTIKTLDSAGHPVDAELAIMMVDASLYAIQPEFRNAIQKRFYGKIRPHQVTTNTSYDFLTGYGSVPFLHIQQGRGMGMIESAAPMAADSRMAKASPGTEGGVDFAVATIRRDFPDSVIWAGQLNTGADGQATADVDFPDSLTTWKLLAVAVDDATRVGEASRDLVVRKDIIARLQTPRFLVEGDRCSIAVIARNDLPVDKRVRVSLSVTGPVAIGDATVDGHTLDYVKPDTVEIPIAAGQEATVDFSVSSVQAGLARFIGTVSTNVAADAMESAINVKTFGAAQLFAESGAIRAADDRTTDVVAFSLPSDMDRHVPILEVHLTPTIAGVMLEAIPYLLDYPYGCTEQTMSRFLPAVVTRRALDTLGVQLSDLARKANASHHQSGGQRWRWNEHPVFNNGVLDDIVAVGLSRLAELQSTDGGWAWFREGRSDPYMSAYVVYGLAEAARAGVSVNDAMFARGVTFLKKKITAPTESTNNRRGASEPNTRMWMLYALSLAEPEALLAPVLHTTIDRVYARRDDLTDYGRAMLAIVLQQTGRQHEASIVVDNFDNTVRVDPQTQTASWGPSSGYRRWYQNGVETTAMVLRALMVTRPNHPYIDQAANWLVRHREGARWHSTKDTAFAVYALADYLEQSGELTADMRVTVTLDGDVTRSFQITPDNVLTFDARMIFAPEHLTAGEHTVRIDKSGTGSIYYSVFADYFTKQDPIAAMGSDLFVTRRYWKLTPRQVNRTRSVWDSGASRYVDETYRAVDYDRHAVANGDSIHSGDLVDVELEIDARNDFEYVVIEDPKPAGCEPVSLRSGPQFNQGGYANVEFRDTHVAFFANWLPQGRRTLTYRVRCETPGAFFVLPTQIDAMYSPYARASSASDRLRIDR